MKGAKAESRGGMIEDIGEGTIVGARKFDAISLNARRMAGEG